METPVTPSNDMNIYQDINETKKVEKKVFIQQALFNLKTYKTLLKHNQKV